MPRWESQWIEGCLSRIAKKKSIEGLRSRQANQTDRGGRAKKQVGRRNPTEKPVEQTKEPQVELESVC